MRTAFHLIVGAKGSPMQLVLNTIYFLDKPIENIPYTYYLDLKANRAIAHAIPFALGDTTEDGRYRIVGTYPEYFEVDYVPGKKLRLRDGKFLEGKRDAVLGRGSHGRTSGKSGTSFPIAHGGNLSDIHDEKFTVVGILAPTGLPIDRGVFIHYDGFYEIRGHGMSEKEAEAEAVARGADGGRPKIMVPNAVPGAAAAHAANPDKPGRFPTSANGSRPFSSK